MRFGYARISKGEHQNIDLQMKALEDHGIDKIISEKASGGRWDRPELQTMIDHLREGDIVVVWKSHYPTS